MFNLGFSELLLLGVIALIFIGPQQLPELARSLGRVLNELKRASNDFQSSFTEPFKDDVMNRIEETRRQMNDSLTSVNNPQSPPEQSTATGPEAIHTPMDTGPKIVHDEQQDPALKLPRGDGNS